MLAAIIPDDSSAATAARAHQLGDVMRLDYDCAWMCRSMRKRSAPLAGFPQVMPMIHAGESKMSGLSRTANAPVNGRHKRRSGDDRRTVDKNDDGTL